MYVPINDHYNSKWWQILNTVWMMASWEWRYAQNNVVLVTYRMRGILAVTWWDIIGKEKWYGKGINYYIFNHPFTPWATLHDRIPATSNFPSRWLMPSWSPEKQSKPFRIFPGPPKRICTPFAFRLQWLSTFQGYDTQVGMICTIHECTYVRAYIQYKVYFGGRWRQGWRIITLL